MPLWDEVSSRNASHFTIYHVTRFSC
jgi:hypothetical protein